MSDMIPVLIVMGYFAFLWLITVFMREANRGPHVHPIARYKALHGPFGWLRRLLGGGR